MRTREEIMKEWGGLLGIPNSEQIEMEILLDIRELLKEIEDKTGPARE